MPTHNDRHVAAPWMRPRLRGPHVPHRYTVITCRRGVWDRLDFPNMALARAYYELATIGEGMERAQLCHYPKDAQARRRYLPSIESWTASAGRVRA